MSPELEHSAYLRACRGKDSTHTPIWLNRQAGRYMPEYHALKGDTPSLEFFTSPELAAQATLDAQRILGVDAAILFADLLPLLVPMGLELDYLPGVGPRFANPVRTAADIAALRRIDARTDTGYIMESVRRVRAGLPADIPLIGFAGAPFTLASYAVEGQGSRNYIHVKRMMYSATDDWHELMRRLVDAIADYVNVQIDAGVQAVQLFDSWVGCLSVEDYRSHAKAHTRRLIEAISGRVPVVYFGTGNPHLVDDMAECGADVMALDWRTPLVPTWDRLGLRAVQGNLDPIVLCAEWPAVEAAARQLLEAVGNRPGHIFNLGHGIVPETPVDNVKRLVELVRTHTRRR